MTAINEIEQYLTAKYEIKENLVNGFIYIREKEGERWELINEATIWRELLTARLNISMPNLIHLLKSSFTPKFDPIKEYFLKLPEVNHDWIAEICNYIEVTGEQKEFNDAFKKHLVRAVECALIPGRFNKHCLVLVSREQNNGKSTFCRWLCPDKLKEYYTENITTDKDSLISLSENFLINLDELSTLHRAEINALKSVFSKDIVKVRKPYERRATLAPRRCTFLGSTNRSEFLNDESGTVRWLCFDIKKINWAYTKDIDINQIWGYAYKLFNDGFNSKLCNDEIKANESRNTNFNITNIEEELIISTYTPATGTEPAYLFMTSTEIMLDLQATYQPRQPLNIINIGKALSKMQYTKQQRWNGKFQQKGYILTKSK